MKVGAQPSSIADGVDVTGICRRLGGSIDLIEAAEEELDDLGMEKPIPLGPHSTLHHISLSIWLISLSCSLS
jgi:hypothetical protein